MADRKEDAQIGILCQAAYFVRGPVTLQPVNVPVPAGWEIRGYFSAQDAIFRGSDGMSGERVYYGFLAESTANPGHFIAALRGTIDMIEWGENGQFVLKRHPAAGHVETGFFDIYQTLQLDNMPAVVGICSHVGISGSLTIVGHSLGAAIGTYLAFDMASVQGTRVRARLFASPHPGDAAFVAAFDATLADYVSYAYELDVVPRVPFGFGYCHLPKMAWLNPKNTEARIRFDLLCHHSMVSYISMLDYAAYTNAWALDPSCRSCVTEGQTAMSPAAALPGQDKGHSLPDRNA